MKKGFVVAIATGIALALTPGPGSAHDSTAGTGVEDLFAGRFQGTSTPPTEINGRVVSKNARCERGRRVAAFHDVLPLGPGQEDFPLGEATTNRNGEFALTTPFAPDKVYVVVEQKGSKNKRHRHKCKPHTSKTVDAQSYK